MGKVENYVEAYLVKKAQHAGFKCYKTVSPGINGFPDRLLLAKGYAIFVETKSINGVLSEHQKIRIKEMQDQNALVCVINTREGVDQLITLLKGKRKRSNKL